jgi:putative ABC transport system substrate-binding protein
LRGLTDRGWIEGLNVLIEWRFAGGHAERLADLAAELVRLEVDVIVVPSTPTALVAKNATRTIPIVTIAIGDPVGLGLVASLARPRGDITGLTAVVNAGIAGKQLELLKKTVPRAFRVAVLRNPATTGTGLFLRET